MAEDQVKRRCKRPPVQRQRRTLGKPHLEKDRIKDEWLASKIIEPGSRLLPSVSSVTGKSWVGRGRFCESGILDR